MRLGIAMGLGVVLAAGVPPSEAQGKKGKAPAKLPPLIRSALRYNKKVRMTGGPVPNGKVTCKGSYSNQSKTTT